MAGSRGFGCSSRKGGWDFEMNFEHTRVSNYILQFVTRMNEVILEFMTLHHHRRSGGEHENGQEKIQTPGTV